jgi:hypothetical protein
VPVLILPVRTTTVMRELRRLSQYPKLRAVGLAAAAVGATSLVDLAFAGLRRLRYTGDVRVEEVDRFAGWSDAVWRAAQPLYGALARRDGPTLDRLYRPGDRRLIRLKLSRGSGCLLGWIAVTVRESVDDPEYGNLRQGVLADCLASPKDAGVVVAAGIERLVAEGVDLIRARFSHVAWITAARRAGFVPVPSTTHLFASPPLSGSLPQLRVVHLTHGDNDGPLPYDQKAESIRLGEAGHD